MPALHKIAAALLLVMPGGFVLGPLLYLWVRRRRRLAATACAVELATDC